ncbi:MAG TPA: MarR family transcriptional regulator, partial [Thermomicrobiales bacterium]|nr:MarR family transcriptional regulator [Thermomicrobiales bacterium]
IVNDHQTHGEAAEGWQHKRQQLADMMRALAVHVRALRDPSDWTEVELTMPQVRALDLLVGNSLRMSELAAALHTSLQATTSLIDRLVDKGLVERTHDTADRRVVICTLTPAGLAEMERMYRIGQARFEILLDLLSEGELDTVLEAFGILTNAAHQLKRQDGAPATTSPGRSPVEPHEKVNAR